MTAPRGAAIRALAALLSEGPLPYYARREEVLAREVVALWRALWAQLCLGVYDDDPQRIVACGTTPGLYCGRCAALAATEAALGEMGL